MKYILTLMLFTAINLSAQAIQDDVNAIIIRSEGGTDLYKAFGKILLKEGYSLEEADRSFGIISTKPRIVMVSGSFMDHELNMKIIGEILQDSTGIKLTAKFGDPAFGSNTIEFQAKNTSGSFADAFGELNRLAELLKDKQIKYLIEEGK